MTTSRLLKRAYILVGVLFTLSACETVIPNPLPPEVRESLRISDIQVTLDPAWIDTLEERGRKSITRKAEKEYKLAKARANARKRKTIPEPVIDEAEIKAAVDKNVNNMLAALNTALGEKFADYPSGTRPTILKANITSYHASNAGETIMIGGSQSVNGTAYLIDKQTRETLAAYDINVYTSNQGGLLVALLDAAFFGDKPKELSNMFARDLMSRIKADT